MPRVTLQTIADHIGVSRMTVSNAFSRPDQLSPDLRRRILDAAEALGYTGPDPAARALATGTAGAVGILLTDSLRHAFTDEVAAVFLGAIADEMAASGRAITLLTTSTAGGIIPARDLPLDGAVVYSCDPDSTSIDWLRRRRLPLVLVDQDPDSTVTSVNIADRAGARAAAQHLIDLGHRRVDILMSSFDGPHGVLTDPVAQARGHVQRERLLGWIDALAAAGITPRVYAEDQGESASGYRCGLELLAERGQSGSDEPLGRPTALLCFSDTLALGVLRAAHELGLDVPGDVSVVGFDDSPSAQRSLPRLTTVHQDAAGKGRAAGIALRDAIDAVRLRDQPDVNEPAAAVMLPVALVVRDSTGPAPSAGTAANGG